MCGEIKPLSESPYGIRISTTVESIIFVSTYEFPLDYLF